MSETQKYIQSVIKSDELDPTFKYEISKMPGAEDLMVCFQCGTCTAGCPVSLYSNFYKPRRIARMVQLGLKDRLLSDEALWLCTTCFTCVDRCPQGVDIAGVVRALRNLSVKEKGVMPLVSKELASNILKTGYVYKFPKSRLKMREKKGLPPLPESNVDDVKKIFKVTGASKLLDETETLKKVES
ncbi:MAG: 4Fe-4S dicluster domain-containing protein [Thermoproteota archaeon]